MKSIYNTVRLFLLSLLLGLPLTSCDEGLWEFKDENKGSYMPAENEPISTTLENMEMFSEWIHVLEYSDTYSALNQGTQGVKYTVMAPSDEAVQRFYESVGVSSIEDLGMEYAKALVKTHIYQGDSVKFSDKFGVNVLALFYTNAYGTTWSVELDSINPGYVLNSNIHLEKEYIKAANGFIYLSDGLIEPLVETLYDRVAQNPDYSIMRDALHLSGYADSLDVVADTIIELGQERILHRNYTFLTVSNANFAKNGINSIDDLKNALALRAEDATVTPDSLVKQYVEYHLLNSRYTQPQLCDSISSDSVKIWGTSASNQIFTLTRHIKEINSIGYNIVVNKGDTSYVEVLDTVYQYCFNEPDAPVYFVNSSRNQLYTALAQNGYLHEIDGWLPIYEPKQSTVVWDLADNAKVRALAGQHPDAPVSSESKISISNCFLQSEMGPEGSANNSYSAISYVTCKSNLKNCVNYDRVVFNLGYQGYVKMETPTIVKGKYKVTLSMAYLTELAFIRTCNGCKGGTIKISIDEEDPNNPEVKDTRYTKLVSPYTTITKSLAGVYECTLYDEVEFDITSKHVFKIVVMDPAASTNSKFSLHFDAITFTPIEE